MYLVTFQRWTAGIWTELQLVSVCGDEVVTWSVILILTRSVSQEKKDKVQRVSSVTQHIYLLNTRSSIQTLSHTFKNKNDFFVLFLALLKEQETAREGVETSRATGRIRTPYTASAPSHQRAPMFYSTYKSYSYFLQLFRRTNLKFSSQFHVFYKSSLFKSIPKTLFVPEEQLYTDSNKSARSAKVKQVKLVLNPVHTQTSCPLSSFSCVTQTTDSSSVQFSVKHLTCQTLLMLSSVWSQISFSFFVNIIITLRMMSVREKHMQRWITLHMMQTGCERDSQLIGGAGGCTGSTGTLGSCDLRFIYFLFNMLLETCLKSCFVIV